jgi:hypothetical protein
MHSGGQCVLLSWPDLLSWHQARLAGQPLQIRHSWGQNGSSSSFFCLQDNIHIFSVLSCQYELKRDNEARRNKEILAGRNAEAVTWKGCGVISKIKSGWKKQLGSPALPFPVSDHHLGTPDSVWAPLPRPIGSIQIPATTQLPLGWKRVMSRSLYHLLKSESSRFNWRRRRGSHCKQGLQVGLSSSRPPRNTQTY